MPVPPAPTDVLVLALPETAGSALYGLVDVLSSAGTLWQTLARTQATAPSFKVTVVGLTRVPFVCGNGIPVTPEAAIGDDPPGDILVLPEIWLGPDEAFRGRYPELMEWIRRRFQRGNTLYSACSGSIVLAETGLLDGRDATSHWGYEDLFRTCYPKVRFRAEPNLAFADAACRIVTAGGTTSWHDLALHIIARHASPAEATRIAKVYLLKWHDEGQLPYAALVRRNPHADAVVRRCEDWLAQHSREHDALAGVLDVSGLPARTLKRRFKVATGTTLIGRLQDLRVEEAKRLLEETDLPVDEISAEVGYEDASFFRRVFRRRTGLQPSRYRLMFQSRTTSRHGLPGNTFSVTGDSRPERPRTSQ